MFESFYEQLAALGVVPVVVLDRVEDAAPLAHALVAGGLPAAEVTFRTPVAADCIATMREAEPDMIVGAGTVLSIDQAELAIANGARFVVSPGFSEPLVKRVLELEVPALPGTVTPSEVMAARQLGLTVTKFFPAANFGGLTTIKALGGPFPTHRFMPTGGVDAGNLKNYLTCPNIIACGGTWMVKQSLFANGSFEAVERLAREAATIVKSLC